jgi:hypothetical protein
MAAGTVGLPVIVLPGEPVLDGHYQNRLAGSGTIEEAHVKRYQA